MAGTGQGYDLSVTTYSPDGRIFQIDYAKKCIDKSFTSLGIVCKDGVVLASQKAKQNRMLVTGTNKKAYAIHRNCGMVVCGVPPEGRHILNRARHEAEQYKSAYGDQIPGYLLAERVGAHMHLFTMYASVRPFGCSLLFGNYDPSEGPTLFSIEACGTVQKWFGKAFGKGRQLANTEIEKLDLRTLTCEQALFHIAKILQKVHDESTPFEIEVNWIREADGYTHQIVPNNKVEEARNQAKAAIEEEDD